MLKYFLWIGLILNFASCALLVEAQEKKSRKLHDRSFASGCVKEQRPLVVLGGGMESTTELSVPSKARVHGAFAFIKEHRANEDNLIIFSGGPVAGKKGRSEASLMKEMFQGLAKSSNLKLGLVEEDDSYSTKDNARFTDKLLKKLELKKKIILMTDLFHLPRATRNFTEAGFQVCSVMVVDRERFVEEFKKSEKETSANNLAR